MTTNILTVQEVAEELEATELEVMRVIARGSLKAVKLGSEGNLWRVTRDELLKFVSAHSEDLPMPPSDHGWFDDQDLSPIDFRSAIKSNTRQQLLTDDQIIGLSAESEGTRSLNHRLVATPSVMRVVGTQLGDKFRFASLGENYVAAELRAEARRQMNPLPSLSKIYSSPAELANVVNAAMIKVLAGKVAYYEQRLVDGSNFTIFYELLNTSWTTPEAVFQIVNKAF